MYRHEAARYTGTKREGQVERKREHGGLERKRQEVVPSSYNCR
jgi:hypothetical protein